MSVQATAMFDRYFKHFEGNELKGHRYQLVLLTGQVVSGVPSVSKGTGSEGSFTVALGDGSHRTIQWNRLLSAAPLG